MAKIADIKDPTFRGALEEADGLIASGDYTKAAVKCAETWVELLNQKPELIPQDGAPGAPGAPKAGRDPAWSGGASGYDPQRFNATRAMARFAWPITGGLNVEFDADRKPMLTFDKQRFSLSEAVTYLEFMVEQLDRIQKMEATA